MGYKFLIETENLILNDIDQGNVSSDGLFNDKISEDKNNGEVIWTNSEEVKKDGLLFFISAEIKDTKKYCSINLTYSKSDTFDESYNEIDLVCENIIISPEIEVSQGTSSNTSYDNQVKEEIIIIETEKKVYTKVEIKNFIDSLSKDSKAQFIENFNEIIIEKYNNLPVIKTDDGIEVIDEILECIDEYTIKSVTRPVIRDEDFKLESTNDKNVSTADQTGKNHDITVIVIAIIIRSIVMSIANTWAEYSSDDESLFSKLPSKLLQSPSMSKTRHMETI